jgi:osmotically-inducible protein OsmY
MIQPARILASLCLLALVLAPALATAAGKCEVREQDISFFSDNAKTVALGAKLQFNKVLMQEKVLVKVSGGVAILSGNVSSNTAIRTAVRIASETGGIRCVQNHLKIGPPLPEQDRSLRN